MYFERLLKYTIVLVGIIILLLLVLFKQPIISMFHQLFGSYWNIVITLIKVTFSGLVILLFTCIAKSMNEKLLQKNETE